MNLIDRATDKVVSINGKLTSCLLKVGLPRYGKKLVFVVSLFVGLKHLKTIDVEELRALNEKLQLASCPEALEFPALFSKRIWDKSDIETATRYNDLEGSSRLLVSSMPKWLQYSTYEKMVEDAKDVLRLTQPVVA